MHLRKQMGVAEGVFTQSLPQHVGDVFGKIRYSLMVSCSAEWQVSSVPHVTKCEEVPPRN